MIHSAVDFRIRNLQLNRQQKHPFTNPFFFFKILMSKLAISNTTVMHKYRYWYRNITRGHLINILACIDYLQQILPFESSDFVYFLLFFSSSAPQHNFPWSMYKKSASLGLFLWYQCFVASIQLLPCVLYDIPYVDTDNVLIFSIVNSFNLICCYEHTQN